MLKLRALLPAMALSLLLLDSCSQKVHRIHLLTDRKELAAAVEIYNASRNDVLITFRHVDFLDRNTIETENPDLIIGSHLESPLIIDMMHPLDMDFSSQDFVIDGPRDNKGRLLLLPLSYELPLIVGKKTVMDSLSDPSTVRPEELRRISADFNISNREGRLIRLGFSPLWNSSFLIDFIKIRHPQIFSNGMDQVNQEALTAVIDEVRLWVEEQAGSVFLDNQFSKRYRYVPDDYLIHEGRILFARIDFAAWAGMPDSVKQDLDIRYLRGERTIPVVSVVSGGIMEKSNALKASQEFIAWLSLLETQIQLMDRWETDGTVLFGFLGGLSTTSEVNNTVLIKRFPSLIGMLPQSYFLTQPTSVPHRWMRIKNEVLSPWLLSSINEPEKAGSLLEAFRHWDLSSLVESE